MSERVVVTTLTGDTLAMELKPAGVECRLRARCKNEYIKAVVMLPACNTAALAETLTVCKTGREFNEFSYQVDGRNVLQARWWDDLPATCRFMLRQDNSNSSMLFTDIDAESALRLKALLLTSYASMPAPTPVFGLG